jgi:hypothetical protein
MLGQLLLVTVVQLLLVDALLDEEDVGAQLEDGIQLGGCELAPRFAEHGTIGHVGEFNGRHDLFLKGRWA